MCASSPYRRFAQARIAAERSEVLLGRQADKAFGQPHIARIGRNLGADP